MNILKRLFKIGQSEAHDAANKMEDPIKMTEQGIRDLKGNLDESLKAYAEVKSMAIKAKKEYSENSKRAKQYEEKATQLVEKAENGEIESEEADRLASEALQKKKEATEQAEVSKKNMDELNAQIENMDKKIKKLRSDISHYENELKTLKARQKVGETTKKMNKQMANIDNSSTVSTLNRMKEKVDKEEAMAEAYGDIADENKSVDDEIDETLNSSGSGSQSDELADLKAKVKKNKGQ